MLVDSIQQKDSELPVVLHAHAPVAKKSCIQSEHTHSNILVNWRHPTLADVRDDHDDHDDNDHDDDEHGSFPPLTHNYNPLSARSTRNIYVHAYRKHTAASFARHDENAEIRLQHTHES